LIFVDRLTNQRTKDQKRPCSLPLSPKWLPRAFRCVTACQHLTLGCLALRGLLRISRPKSRAPVPLKCW
jgi:hypothetical protein